MPIYDYRCGGCGKTFELLVRATTVPACPDCGGQALEKLASLPAPQATTPGLLRSARAQAAKEGHFSNYSAAERRRT